MSMEQTCRDSRAKGTDLGIEDRDFRGSGGGGEGTTQAIGQQHTSPLRAGCEARRREIALIFGCGNGLARESVCAFSSL